MTKEKLERLHMDIYDNGILDNDYKEKFKRYVNNRIESLEKEKCELLGIIQGKDKAIADIEKENADNRDKLLKENAELKEQNANLISMLKSEHEVRVNDDYLKGICELEGKVEDWTSEYYELENLMNNKLSEAKEIIKGLLSLKSTISSVQDTKNRFSVREKAEEFLKEAKE